MANAHITDALALAWGRALASNASLTSLNLESNAIATAGILAIAQVHDSHLPSHTHHPTPTGRQTSQPATYPFT
eukprot:1095527-Prymnesium_polylepis.1